MQNTKIAFSANLAQIERALEKQRKTPFFNSVATEYWIKRNWSELKEIISELPKGNKFSLERGVSLTENLKDEFVPAAKKLQKWSNETAFDFLTTHITDGNPQGKNSVKRMLGHGNPNNTNGFQLKSLLEYWRSPDSAHIEI